MVPRPKRSVGLGLIAVLVTFFTVQQLGSVKSRVSISRQPRRGLPRKAKHQAKLYNTATSRRSERAAVILHPLLLVVTWNIKFKKASDLPHEVAAQICQVIR